MLKPWFRVSNKNLYLQTNPLDVRFQSVTSDNGLFDWYQSQAVCETLGRNLAIIKTDADMADLNTTVTFSKLHQQPLHTNITSRRAYIGLMREFAAEDWTWYTGEALDVAWPYWDVGQPDSPQDNVCARILFLNARWLLARDNSCLNSLPYIICE